MLHSLLALVSILMLTIVSDNTEESIIIQGSHPGWAYDEYPPETMDYSPWTHIMQFGALVTSNGRIDGDSLSASDIKRGVESAHRAGRPVMAVIGSEGNGAQFATASRTATSRQRLADSIAGYVRANGHDGVSIDWEEDINGAHYVDLLDRVDMALDRVDPALTVSSDVVSGLVPPQTAAKAEHSVDWFSIMSYWSDGTDEISAYMDAGIPARKLAVGIGLSPDYRDQRVSDVVGKIKLAHDLGLRGVEVWAIQQPDLRNGFHDPRLSPLRDAAR